MSDAQDKSIFIAGAAGAIGRVLCRLLLRDGWRVTGTTRSASRAGELRALGVEPAVVDVYDRAALIEAVRAARPAVVMHQLTDLPQELSPASMAAARARNARVREEGTAHLMAAAEAGGARRVVAQSIAFAYVANASRPITEDAPIDTSTAAAVARLEELVLGHASLQGVVLRYGRLYGPGTWFASATGEAPLHVDAAADAARRAATQGAGLYNVAEDDGVVNSGKVWRDLGWRPEFRAG